MDNMEQQNQPKVNKILARGIATGYNLEDVDDYDINTAIVLNRLRWLHSHTRRKDGFTWQTAQDWYDHTRLTDYQVKKSLDILEADGIIEVKTTYITGTLDRARHHRFLISENLETSVSEIPETLVSIENQETSVSIYSKEHSKEHSNKELVSKDTNAKPSVLASENETELEYIPEPTIKPKKTKTARGNPEVNGIIKLFEDELGVKLPPENRRYAKNLISQHGYSKLLSLSKLVLEYQGQKFFPVVSTPKQLYYKMPDVANYLKNADKRSMKGMIVI